MQGPQTPLWNAQPPPLNGSGFSLPFWDHTSYEHHGVSPQSVDHKQWMGWIVFIPVDHTSFDLNCMDCPHSCGSHKLWMVWIVWIPVDHTSFERYRQSSFLWTTPALKEQQSSLSLWTTPMSLTSYSRGPAMTEKAKWWITLPDKGAAIRMLAVVLVSDFCCWFFKYTQKPCHAQCPHGHIKQALNSATPRRTVLSLDLPEVHLDGL